MEKNYLKVVYSNQKSFYKKAFYTKTQKEELTIYRLYSYNTHVLTIYINNDDISKSYYVCNKDTAYSKTTLKHVKEFIHQIMTTKMNVYSILEYMGMTKNNILKYTRVNKPLQEVL